MGLGTFLRSSASTSSGTAGDMFRRLLRDGGLGESAPYRGGMGLPGAWRASTLVADLLGSVPWHAYRERGGEPVQKIEPTPAILDRPVPSETRMTTFSAWALDLIWHGNAIGVVATRNSDGVPTSVLPVSANRVGIRSTVPGRVFAGQAEYEIDGRTFRPYDIIHIKGHTEPGQLRGFGVLEAHLNGSINLLKSLQSEASSVVNNGGVPTGKLTVTNPDATKEDLEEAKAGWLRAQRERTIAVLNSSTEFETVGWNPSEQQLLQARQFGLQELALIFGIPAYFLGAEESTRTYSNVQDEAINLLKFSLGGHLARFEQTLSNILPRGTWAKANLDSVLRADTLTRYKAHQIGIKSKFLQVNEARDMEDLPPLSEEELQQLQPPEPGGNEDGAEDAQDESDGQQDESDGSDESGSGVNGRSIGGSVYTARGVQRVGLLP